MYYNINIKKGEINVKKKLIISFCSVLLAFVVIGGCDYIANKSIENVKKEQNNNNKVKYEKQKESYDNKFTDKYGALLDSDKLYENMTDEEGNLAVEMVKDFESSESKISEKLKNKYKDRVSSVKTSINDYNNKKEAERIANELENRQIEYNSGITYEQISRNPDDYLGKRLTLNGKAIQVVEGDREIDVRLAVDNNYDKVILVAISKNMLKSRILEKDNLTVKGKFEKMYSYTSSMNVPVTVPLVIGEEIINNQQ